MSIRWDFYFLSSPSRTFCTFCSPFTNEIYDKEDSKQLDPRQSDDTANRRMNAPMPKRPRGVEKAFCMSRYHSGATSFARVRNTKENMIKEVSLS